MFFKKFLNRPNVVGTVLIALMVCGGLVYTFAFDGFNVQTVTGSEVEAWLAAAGGGSSGGSGGGGSDDMSPESPTPENPEDEEEEDEEGEEGGTEGTPPEDPEDDGEGSGEGEDGGEGGGDDDDDDDEFDWFNVDFHDTSNWPTPPTSGTFSYSGGEGFREGNASLEPYKSRGEKSLYDGDGGEWRPFRADDYVHDVIHWDYKPYKWNDNQNRNIGKWENVDLSGESID